MYRRRREAGRTSLNNFLQRVLHHKAATQKRVLRWLLILILSLITIAIKLSPALASETPQTALYLQYIEWPFYTYKQPDFKSRRLNKYQPQNVRVFETSENGWAKVSTNKGLVWVNIERNCYFIGKPAKLYNNKGDTTPIADISDQVVNVVESDGNWICLETWLGLKWVNAAELDPDEAPPDETPSEPLYSQYIEWSFNTYEQPDFKSKILERHESQNVNVHEAGENGWVKISTYKGYEWVNTERNEYYIEKTASLYNNKDDKEPVAEISEQVVTVIEGDGSWMRVETWLGLKWISIDEALRDEVLLDVPIYNQLRLGLPTGCEIVATAMMINYTRDVSINTLVSNMPRSSNPNSGFRGNPHNSGGFTIYPTGLVNVVSQYMGSADNMSTDEHKCTMDDVKRKINSNKPVVAWVNGLGFNVHAICITGYNTSGFYYNDPWTGRKNAFISNNSFYSIWNRPIPDRLGHKNTPYCKALSY